MTTTDILYFILVAFVSYFIGTINFSKILAWQTKHKDITKLGSGNPGTMNMLRNFGFILAFATFIAEVIKSGLTCLVFKLLLPQYDQVIYFVSAIFLMIGYNFPVWSKFKGGKGVACLAGIFLFSNLWYVAMAWFIVCFIIFMFVEYGSVISFIYTGGLTIAYTIYVWLAKVQYAWLITIFVWALFILILVRHHSNIKRLINHTENKINFRAHVVKVFCHKKGEQIIDEQFVDNKPEKEIIVTDLQKKEENNNDSEEVKTEINIEEQNNENNSDEEIIIEEENISKLNNEDDTNNHDEINIEKEMPKENISEEEINKDKNIINTDDSATDK